MPHSLETYVRNPRHRLDLDLCSLFVVILILIFAVCYRKEFGIKGYGFGQGGPALLSGDIGER